jgi:hypothetical protein
MKHFFGSLLFFSAEALFLSLFATVFRLKIVQQLPLPASLKRKSLNNVPGSSAFSLYLSSSRGFYATAGQLKLSGTG